VGGGGGKIKEVGEGAKCTFYLFVVRENKRIKPKFSREINLLQHLQPITLGLKIPNAWTVRLMTIDYDKTVLLGHFYFSRVDFLLCKDDTALQNNTADAQNKTSSYQNV